MNSECRVTITDKDDYRWINKKVNIDYAFLIEMSSYGIKDITFGLSRVGIGEEFGKGKEWYESYDLDEDTEREIEIDVSKYIIIEDWYPAGHYAIDAKKGIEVDEGRKTITVGLYYLSKGNDF